MASEPEATEAIDVGTAETRFAVVVVTISAPALTVVDAGSEFRIVWVL
jgi:hypothetical protein